MQEGKNINHILRRLFAVLLISMLLAPLFPTQEASALITRLPTHIPWYDRTITIITIGGGGGGGGSVRTPTISNNKLTLVAGHKVTLSMRNTTRKPVWRSSKPSVATVSSNGVVTARKAGTTTITATIGGRNYTCKVTVKKAVFVSRIKLNKTSAPMLVGKTLKLSCTLSPAKSKLTETYKLTWSSSNKKVATVDSNGKVTAKGKGTAIITAKLTQKGKTAKKATCKVTVNTGVNKLLTLMKNKKRLASGNMVISYNASANTYTVTKTDIDCITTLVCSAKMTGNARISYTFTGRFTGATTAAYTSVPIKSINRYGTFGWTYTSGSASYANFNLGNANAQSLLSSLNGILLNRIGGGLNDVGFTRY